MKIDVTEYEKKYSFELLPITQLCGQNIVRKTYILESIRRYFSTYKYREEKNKWRDNVRIDNEVVGRQFFVVLSVKGMEDLLEIIKFSKKSLMIEYVKQLAQTFEWQTHLQVISEELEKMFHIMNTDINRLGDIELTYEISDIWDIIRESNIIGNNQTLVEDKANYELLMIFLNLIEKIMTRVPKKMLIIIENIDHLISREEYVSVLERIKDIGIRYNIYFILSTCMDGYAVCDKELCSGITVFGDVDFQMPEFDKVLDYIYENYPCNKKLSEKQLRKILAKTIHKIGQSDYLYDVEENVVCKLINQTLILNEKWENKEKIPEIAFLKA